MDILGESSLFCEGIFRFLMPNFFSNMNSRFTTIFDYLNHLNNLDLNQNSHDINVKNLTLDLLNYYQTCTNAESNFLYFLWILNIFKPILSTFFCLLLILPLLICLTIYASSIYLLVTKHWRRFKVSFKLNQTNNSPYFIIFNFSYASFLFQKNIQIIR